jgi:uncharacterized protein
MSTKKTPEEIEKSIKIEFPCDYPIKVVGDAVSDFNTIVLDIILKYSPDLNRSSINIKDSKNSNYRSLSVTIIATGKDQLSRLFEELKSTGIVKLVL